MICVQRLAARDAKDFRDIRLEGLTRHPEAFAASLEYEEAQPLEWFAARLTENVVIGAHDGGHLVGVIGLYVPPSAKELHKGIVWGMYVRGEWRYRGIGAALLTALLREAAAIVEEVRLTVVTTNVSAVRLYERMGFTAYGSEPRALKVGNCYHDELLMASRCLQAT